MDVSLSGRRVLISLLALLALPSLVSCGNRYDLSTERGRRARIDDANFFLSSGQCGSAAEAIDPLYNSIYVNDEVRIIKAATFACVARFSTLTFISNLSSEPNQFKAVTKSLDSTPGDGARSAMYSAVDILTQGGVAMTGASRSARENTFMVFVQFGVISSIFRNYGAPAADGSKGTDLVYDVPVVTPLTQMADVDACALAAAYSFITDSYDFSDLNDSTSQGAVDTMNGVCTGVGLPSCNQINRVRSLCDGANAESSAASLLVGGVNTNW